MKTKKCSKCGGAKDLSEFNKDKSRKGGLCNNCKLCCKKWRDDNKDIIKKLRFENKDKYKKHYEENKEKIAIYQKKYQQENKERLSLNKKKYHSDNKESLAVYNKKWRIDNKEKISISARKHWIENKESLTRRVKDQRELMSDPYIKALLSKNNPLSHSDIPQSLVELKRAHIKIKRKLQEMQL